MREQKTDRTLLIEERKRFAMWRETARSEAAELRDKLLNAEEREQRLDLMISAIDDKLRGFDA